MGGDLGWEVFGVGGALGWEVLGDRRCSGVGGALGLEVLGDGRCSGVLGAWGWEVLRGGRCSGWEVLGKGGALGWEVLGDGRRSGMGGAQGLLDDRVLQNWSVMFDIMLTGVQRDQNVSLICNSKPVKKGCRSSGCWVCEVLG